MALALEGIRILDLSIASPGGFCTLILADLGAEVIMVEQPRLEGARQRGSPNSPALEPGNLALNRNKKSIALNLKTQAAREVFYKLAERSDVILEGFRPGVVKRLRIDYDTIKEINPRIIYCSISGYGQDGPYRDLPGHDLNYIAMGGILGIIGPKGGPPSLPGISIGDQGGGSMFATIGILIALLARERTGRGQFVDVSILDGLLSWLTGRAGRFFATGESPRPGEMPLAGLQPSYNIYQTKDGGYISLGVLEPWFWERLCRALGREDLVPWQGASGEKGEEIFAFFRDTFRTRTKEEWFRLLREQDIEVAPVQSFVEAFSDPHVLHRQMVVEVEHPLFGRSRQVGIPIKFSETPGQIRTPAPLLGQHTEEILRALGYGPEEIADLRRTGAIASPPQGAGLASEGSQPRRA